MFWGQEGQQEVSLIRRTKIPPAVDAPDGLTSFISLIRSMPVLLTFKQVGELLNLGESTVRLKKAGTEELTHISMGNADSKRPEYRISRDEVEQLIVNRYLVARAPREKAAELEWGKKG